MGGLPLQRLQKSGVIALSLQRGYPQESAFESLLDFSLRKQTPETMRTPDGSHQQPEEQPAPPWAELWETAREGAPDRHVRAQSHQSYLTLWDPMDCSPPGSSVHGILQARILEWVAVPSSRGFSWPRDWTCISMSPALAGRFFTTSATWEAPCLNRRCYQTHSIPLLWSLPQGNLRIWGWF